MYQPTYHREDDLTKQHALILACPLGLLITNGHGRSHSQSGPVSAPSLSFQVRNIEGAFSARKSTMA